MNSRGDYGERLRRAMDSYGNPFGRPVTLRELEKATGYSYEHLRKVLNDQRAVVSSDFNLVLCRCLGLNEKRLWAVAKREKVDRRARELGIDVVPTADSRIGDAWLDLTPEEREVACRFIEALAERNRNDSRDGVSISRGRRSRASTTAA